jgi:hypothetical protein
MKKICLFSSDARPLYKQDVFRAMSYPKGFVIHFRYQSIHVNEDIRTLPGKTGVIFFSTGNDLSIAAENRKISHVSIREVTIHSIEESNDTGLIHFYLLLGEFKSISLSDNPPEKLPPQKLVTELDVTEGKIAKWFEVVESIKSSFPHQLFYKFQIGQNKGNKTLKPQYNNLEKQSYYQLSDESNYTIEMAFFDTEPSSSDNYHSLKVTSINESLVKLIAPTTIDLEARRDDRKYSIFTQTITSSGTATYFNFETILKSATGENSPTNRSTIDTTLKIEVSKNSKRTFAFACYTVLAAFSVGYAKLLTDKIDLSGSFSWSLSMQFLLVIILGFISAFQLYKLFDKK